MQRRHTVTRTDLHQIGSIDLLDLDIISRSYGRDFLPYPFMLTRSSKFVSEKDFRDYATSVPDRFNHGDLRVFRRWAAAYAYSDIRVECRVQYIASDTPSIRIVAHRVGELGYLATQRADEDVVDVFEVPPLDLSRAIVESIDLVKPGDRSDIVIPEYLGSPETTEASEDFTIREEDDAANGTEIRRADVTAFGTVQSHWRPTRRWGFDRGKEAAIWVRIRDDGEYLYAKDFSRARPMRDATLAERIDALIAEDVKVVRNFRGV